MALVKFNVEDEYIEELKKVKLEQPIVRLTNRQTYSEKFTPLRHLQVVSTAKLANGDIILLERYCGQLWGIEREDKEIWERAEKVHNEIKEACQALKLEIRAGVFQQGG